VAAQDAVPDHPALRDQFYFGAGVYFPQTTTQVEVDSTRFGVGANVDLEDTLGMDRTKRVPTFFGRVRLGERWRIEGEYFQLNRHGERQIDRTIQWGDTTFPVNAQMQSTFNFSDLRVSAGYTFFKTRDKELGVGLGAHVASYKMSVSGTLNGNSVGSDSENVTAPLPVLSAFGQFALTEHWAVGGRLDRFALKYDKYDGSLTALGLDLLYQPFRHVGFGLGVRDLFITLTATDEQKTVKFRQAFQGPVLFMNVSF
jgi:hypothetical protein